MERRIQKRPSPFPCLPLSSLVFSYLVLACLFLSFFILSFFIFSIYLYAKKCGFFRLQKAGLFCYTGSVPLLDSMAEKTRRISHALFHLIPSLHETSPDREAAGRHLCGKGLEERCFFHPGGGRTPRRGFRKISLRAKRWPF